MDGYFNTWWKAFDDYGVDMTFHGHTHNYQRTKPINRNVSTDSPVEFYGSGEGMGRCQVVTGGAGVGLSGPADPNLWWLEKSVSIHHSCNIDIDGDKLTFKAMDINRVVFDSLILDKSNSEIRFELDLNEVTDLYDGGAVWLAFGARDSVFEMADTDGDGIFSYLMTLPIGTELQYNFSYQTGANPDYEYNEETVPNECGDAEGYRFLTVPYGSLTLPAVLYGTCYEVPQNITFQVDLGRVPDLYDGGAVWLTFGARDSVFEMTDPYGDSIYMYTLGLQAGSDLKYYFSYQNGPDPNVNYVDETVPAECSDAGGYRELRVPENYLTLPAVEFGGCDVYKGPPPTISIPLINGNDDAEERTAPEYDDGGAVINATGTVDVGSSDLEFCNEDAPQLIGMIFRDVQIPVGAIITNAYVQFVADDDNYENITVDFFGAAVANVTAAFTGTDFEISAYPQTNARVEWKPEPWTAAEIGLKDSEITRSPDISSVLSEIIAIDGWAPGNGMLIMAQDPDQVAKLHREAESANGSGGTVLNVNFVVYPASVEPGAEFSNTIYPNPTEGIISIINPSTDEFSYEIYSLSGKLVSDKHNIFGQTTEVDMSGLLKGMYIIDVRSADKSVKHKVILQ